MSSNHHRSHKRHKRSQNTPVFLIIVLTIAGVVAVFYWLKPNEENAMQKGNGQEIVRQNIQPISKKGTFKQFTGEQFKDLYENFAYPNAERISDKTPITGNEVADTRIRDILRQVQMMLKLNKCSL
jgi:hypothetical protein